MRRLAKWLIVAASLIIIVVYALCASLLIAEATKCEPFEVAFIVGCYISALLYLLIALHTIRKR